MRKNYLYNTALLSASSLLMSWIGMSFQAWLAARIGTAGIGLYQLVGSVNVLFATLAISGIRFASTRLVSEELGAGKESAVAGAMRRCLSYGALFGAATGFSLWLLAEPIGFLWVGDARTVLSLRLSAFSMPCISLCASVSGYFTANGRVWKPTLVHLAEQLAGIGFTVLFLRTVSRGDTEASCAAVTAGRVCADLLSLLLMLAVFALDRRRYYGHRVPAFGQTGRMLRIAMPLALSAYARSALSTLQQLLIPRGLKAAGYSADSALSGYGIIHGMALPVLYFPSCILSAAAELIVPELTAAQVQQKSGEIRARVRSFLRRSAVFAGSVAAFLFFCAEPLGALIYHNREAGRYIRILAPLVPVMYVDMSVDGCLKGLGQQVWSMGINVFDSVLCIALVYWLLPIHALKGYLFILYASEGINFLLSLWRLWRTLRQLSYSDPHASRRPCAGSAKCACTAAASTGIPPRP